ncbi:MAG: hypothetical protein Q9162_007373, partial [Coniocarpon cinnabarinum]
TKERPFKCTKCRSTFVRRDLLLRHDRTVHAKDGGAPLPPGEGKKRAAPKTSPTHHQSAPFDPTEQDDADKQDQTEDMGEVEAAAMLSGLQQRALENQDSDANGDSDMSAISPHGPAMLDPAAFGPGAMSLPQMPWESLVAHQGADMSSGLTSGSMQAPEAPMAFPDHDLTQPHHGPLPPMMDPSVSQADAMSGINGALSFSGMDTPGALSPFPSMMGPVSPVDYRRSPGPIQPLSVAKAPQVLAEEQCTRILENIKRCDSEVALLETFRLPSRQVLNHYLSTYFDLFHHHLPFLHQASFNPIEVAAPLLLSVLAIGALYTFEQDQAYMLHIGSKVLVNQFLQKKDNFSSRKCPLWTMQSTLLNSIFASWSGDPKGLEWACSIKSLLANMVAGNAYELKLRSEAREGAQPSHEEWIEDEGCRRSYFAVYVFFGMLTLTYNHTPAIGFNELETLELPSSESLWTLDDEEAWRESMTASNVITLRDAHDKLFQGETARYSAFGTRVMINALFLEVWYHKRTSDALQDVVTEYKLRMALENWEKSLELCEPETVVVKLSAPHQGHPLIFNAVAMSRNAKARLLVDLKSIQEALRYHDAFEVAAAMTNARNSVSRSAEMIKVINECYECIKVAAVHGIRWVARTSATNWSVEHPLCAVDLIVILSLWLWRVEHDEEPATEEETTMYNRLRGLFEEDSVDTYGTKLSATVARLWGAMIDEVVVWGITKIIGESFKIHAQALSGYEDSLTSPDGDGQRVSPPLDARPLETLEMQAAY